VRLGFDVAFSSALSLVGLVQLGNVREIAGMIPIATTSSIRRSPTSPQPAAIHSVFRSFPCA
jgi:hypothetical protein